MNPKLFLPILILLTACATDAVTEPGDSDALGAATNISGTTEPGAGGLGSDLPETADSTVVLEVIPADEIMAVLDEAATRTGPLPETPDGIPHQQHNQNAPVEMQEALKAAVSELPGIYLEPTPFSFAGSIGWRLEEDYASGSAGAFIQESPEFGHQHVPNDGSMHMLLPNEAAKIALGKGWGVMHPWTVSISGENSEYVMIFGPRDTDELQTVWVIAQISYYQARGIDMPRSTLGIN